MTNKEIMMRYIESLYNTPYIWGGDTPLTGLDCSGLVIHLLGRIGTVHPTNYDNTAEGLHRDFLKMGREVLPNEERKFGDLVFFRNRTTQRINHVGWILNRDIFLEAGGGGSSTTSKEAAAEKNALVRPTFFPSDRLLDSIVRPNMGDIWER